jgi:IS30 family transposase
MKNLRQHFGVAHQEVEKVKEKVNELVVLVHNDNKDWSIKKICNYIAGKNDDLEHLGFSAKTIYRYLNDENRQLIDSKRYKRQKGDTASKESQALKDFRETKGNTMLENNVIEESE